VSSTAVTAVYGNRGTDFSQANHGSGQERAKIQPLREQIVNVVKDEPVLRLKDLDFSYMLQTHQLTEEDIAWIIEQDNINNGRK
jgi:hypothetical protein